MTEKALPKLPSGQQVKWDENREYPILYSNLMGVGLTPFDMSILFGEVGDATPDLVNGIPRAKIILAPEQIANLIKLLNLALAAYIEANGPLRSAGAVNENVFAEQLQANKVLLKPQ